VKGNTYCFLPLMVALLCCSSIWAKAHTPDLPYQFHSGIRISQTKPPTIRKLDRLIRELSLLSGLYLKVDQDGAIRYERKLRAEVGSGIARELLIKAIDGTDSVSVENADYSDQVAFAQIESTMSYSDGKDRRLNVWCIRIDFADFAQLRGNDAVLQAFNPGMNMMHELTHAILRLPDLEGSKDQLGECERHMNLVRAELGLPLRQYYFPKTRLAQSPTSLARILQGELNFIRGEVKSGAREGVLTFDIAMVVDTQKVKSRSSIPSDLLALLSER
jgi:hypothetical protein